MSQLLTWLHEVMLRALRDHGKPSCRIQSVTDYLDIFYQLEKELTSREVEMDRINEEVETRVSPTHDKPALKVFCQSLHILTSCK